MSTDFRALPRISSADLFDGRLEAFGVYEHCHKDTNEAKRLLIDGDNYLWVFVTNGLVTDITRYAGGGDPNKILNAIAKAFDVAIVSEHQPEYWGFDSKEEWDAAWKAGKATGRNFF